jgi:hypothetical protein
MGDEDKPDKSTIKKGAAVSGIGAILPYAVLAGAGLYLYKKYGEDVQDAFSGVTGAAGGITETINNITETVNKTTKSVTTFIEDNTISKDEATDIEQEAAAFAAGSAPGVKLPKLDKESQKFISKYSDDKKKVMNFRESPYLNLGLGPETSPLKRSMLGLDDKKLIDKAMSYGSKKVQSAQQAEGLTPMAARGAKPDIRTPEQKKSSSSSNRGGLKIVKNKQGMTNKEAQKQGLSPAAWRGI